MSGTDSAPGAILGEEASLWAALRGSQDQPARERLFLLHHAFARAIARRHYRERTRGDLEPADLDQYAFEGLLEAIERYDPDRGVPFRAFASRRISGNVVDGIGKASEMREQLSWSRRMRQDRVRSLSVGNTEQSESALDALAELAVGLALGFMLEDSGLFGSTGEDCDQSMGTAPHAWQSLAWGEMKDLLVQELAGIGSREQTILKCHYMQGMAFEQIASLLGISKGRISQLHRGALATLRKRMAVRGHFRLER
ncbi:sigma-70 family RNA polymerase sigma factor [Novosphingobium sp. CF614]|uniref:sigma-70 family RNA polymerase sigma factor n=1 Tax=Novosphingobium sp. CF614 TaxID=1884364 RepID=UPI0015A6EC1B|nr:sigma-70 family RNA polymerase sigma factor [Novosphingobium sp. CF614]